MTPLFLALLALGDATAGLSIEAQDDDCRIKVIASFPTGELGDLADGRISQAEGERLLRMCLVGEDERLGAPVFGKYLVHGNELEFIPRYGLVRGERYRAVLSLANGRSLEKEYRVAPRESTGSAVVERICPTSDILPANHLKFYIHFSRPMREGRAIFDRIQLLDEDGRPVVNPWRRQELWTSEAQRFTLWIHPGRVKMGVNLREEEGPVLEPGRKYTLVIDATVQDANGQPLGKPFEKKFTTTVADHKRPNPARWKLSPPRTDTKEPVRLEFGEPLDAALLRRFLVVHEANGQELQGEVEVGGGEASWAFRPRNSWKSTAYSIEVDGELEDLAGNTPLRVFDTDLQLPAERSPMLSLPFRPEP